jgi:hypothetical protein
MEFDYRVCALAFFVCLAACHSDAGTMTRPHDGGVDSNGSGDLAIAFGNAGDMPPPATTHVVYKLAGDDHVYRVAARAGSKPEDVSALLAASAGSDSAVDISRDGKWISLTTTRFGCGSWACLALVATSPTGATASTGTLVMAGNMMVHPEGRTAVARDAAFVVFSASGGTHSRDLFLARRRSGAAANDVSAFDAAVPLTNGSTYATHDFPALSADEKAVVCDCQNGVNAKPSLCTVAIDGTGFRTLVTTADVASSSVTEVHSGDFLPDGTVVLEGDWNAEQVWRRDAAGALAAVSPANVTNDNSPCALPDGRVASLWLGRAGNPMGFHELKVMTLDGNAEMVVTGVDILDIGIGCSE